MATDDVAVERLNLLLAAAHLATWLFQLYLLPLLLLPRDALWGVTLVPLAALSNPLWALLHETVHGTFHPRPRANRLAGRLLGVAFGAPWRVLAIGHLLHHRYNREPPDRPEVYEPRQDGRIRFAVQYYFNLLGGLYAGQVLSAAAFLLPRRWLLAGRDRQLSPAGQSWHVVSALTRHGAFAEVRIDGTAVIVSLAVSALCYGRHAWMLACALAARGLCISFLDYVYHYGTALDDRLHGRNLRLPPCLQRALLNFNLHGVHHRHPGLSWAALPAAHAAAGARCDGSFLAAAFSQLRGPIPRPALEGGGRPVAVTTS